MHLLIKNLKGTISSGGTLNINKIILPEYPQKTTDFDLCKSSNHLEDEVVIKHLNYDVYIYLNKYDYFIWKNLDGTKNINEIIEAFFCKFNKFSFQYVKSKIEQFCLKGFIINYQNFDPRLVKPKNSLFQHRFPIPNIEKVFIRAYNAFGKYMFDYKLIILNTILILIGVALVILTDLKVVDFTYRKSIINFIVIYGLFFIPVIIHEFAHAMACIYYGCKVKEAGIMLYIIFPVFYVNTSDSWMVDRKARIIISMAGIFSDIFLSFVMVVLYTLFPNFYYSNIIYHLIFIGYARVILNLNPLLKWDGYYVLMDLLNIHNLRAKAFDFFPHKFVHKIINKIRITVNELKLLLYAIFSLVYLGYFLFYQRLLRIYQLIFIYKFSTFKLMDLVTFIFLIQFAVYILIKFYKILKRGLLK